MKAIPGVVGVVLGGSRARGTHHPTSDIDIGIYYDESEGFDVKNIDKVAAKFDDEHRESLVSGLGEWGEWVNGGAWLKVQGYHVDFIFRDLHRVSRVIAECMEGKVSSHYHAGHPQAFLNYIYMGEVAICNILFERDNQISKLKAMTKPYPQKLKQALIDYFMFEAGFSLMHAKDNIEKDDLSYVTGHCFRTISCLNQVLFALNEEYCINEKKAVRMINGFAVKPENYKERIDQVITLLSNDVNDTGRGVSVLENLLEETKALLGK